MKFLRGRIFGLLVVVLCASIVPTEMCAEVSRGWLRSIYITDYLPNWIQSFIPRARVRQMFHGFGLYYDKIRKIDFGKGSCESEMTKIVQSYDEWMQKYKDIINEGTIISGLSMSTGNPDSILGLWKTFLWTAYMNQWGACLIVGINKIVQNLERMGAKLNPMEELLLKPLSLIDINKPDKGDR